MRWRFFLTALSILPLLTCAFAPLIAPMPSQAAPVARGLQQTDAASESQFLLLYPELRQAPAPPWLRPGVRLTYNSAFATFARNIDDPTPSGAALIQFDVVAQDRRSVVSLTTMYSTQIQGQPPTGLGYEVALPGVGAFWFSPQVLAHADAVTAVEHFFGDAGRDDQECAIGGRQARDALEHLGAIDRATAEHALQLLHDRPAG